MEELYLFWGKVVKGKKRGKHLGFPTANMRLHKEIPEGIYVSTAAISAKRYHAVTFIGAAETFGEKQIKAETYILNFDKNMYGKWLSLRLYKKLRDNKKFKSAATLIAQMKKDVEQAMSFDFYAQSVP